MLGGGLYVPHLNLKPFHVTISEGSHVTVGISSSGLSFVIISAPSCRRFRAVSPSEFTRTGPHHFPGGSPLIVAELYLTCANVVTLLLITS